MLFSLNFSFSLFQAQEHVKGQCSLYLQASHRVDNIDHWSIIDHFAKMVDVLEFVVDIT